VESSTDFCFLCVSRLVVFLTKFSSTSVSVIEGVVVAVAMAFGLESEVRFSLLSSLANGMSLGTSGLD